MGALREEAGPGRGLRQHALQGLCPRPHLLRRFWKVRAPVTARVHRRPGGGGPHRVRRIQVVLVILAGAVAALAACRERVEPTPRSSRPVTPAVVALCEYARWCGRYTHQDPCEQALAMMHPELPLEIVHALKFEEWRRDCEPPSGVDRPCRAPRWSARFAWGDCHGRLFRHIHCGEPGPC